MSLVKREYVDGETVITAKNLNDIQDAIISLEGSEVPDVAELVEAVITALPKSEEVAF